MGGTSLFECPSSLLGSGSSGKGSDLHKAYRVQGVRDLVRTQIEGFPDHALRGPVYKSG